MGVYVKVDCKVFVYGMFLGCQLQIYDFGVGRFKYIEVFKDICDFCLFEFINLIG